MLKNFLGHYYTVLVTAQETHISQPPKEFQIFITLSGPLVETFNLAATYFKELSDLVMVCY